MSIDTRLVRNLEAHWTLGTPRVPVDGGFAIEEAFTVRGTIDDPEVGSIDVEIMVEVVSGRALARSVKVSSDEEVSSTVLRKVAIRDLIAWCIRPVLKRVNLVDGSLESLVGLYPGAPEPKPLDDAAIRAIKSLVSYLDDETAGADIDAVGYEEVAS